MKTAASNSKKIPVEKRLIFFDNLRFLFVCAVVFQHAGMAYNGSGWWPVQDGSSIAIGLLTAFTDGFLMPGLFYISGYFAVISIARRGILSFITSKLKRLGTAWLVCTLFIGPVLPFVYHYTRNAEELSTGYLDIWFKLMQNALKFDVGLMPPMANVMQNDLFYQRYMWFISLLLAFYLLFSVVYLHKKEWFNPCRNLETVKPAPFSILKMILLIGLTTFLGSTGLITIMFLTSSQAVEPDSTWFTLGNIVQFRVSRIVLHGAYFTLGILTYKYRQLVQDKFLGHGKTWAASFMLAAICYYTFLVLTKISEADKELYGLLFWFCLNFFTISAIGLSLFLAISRLNSPTAVTKNLVANSFHIYLAHYLFVIGFQLLFSGLAHMPVLLKYFLTAILSLIAAFGAGHFLIRPYPRTSIVLLVLNFIIMIHLFKV